MSAPPSAYSLRDATVRLGEKDVLSHVTADFSEARLHVVRGASGAGKTTLLRLLMGLLEPASGGVLRPEGARLAATFQEDRLLDALTVSANVRLPHGHLCGSERDALLDETRRALAAVGMAGLETARAGELSGGQRRRVSLLRAALATSDVVFLDEPMRGLDEGTARATMAWLLPRLESKTVFWVTHSEAQAAALPDPVLWTVGGGRVRPLGM